MSTEHFTITEHIIPASHIREFPGCTVYQDDILRLHVKQYTPKPKPNPNVSPADESPPKDRDKNSNSDTNAITIIAAHGVALPKELYEPLWDELLPRCRARGVEVRALWIADFVSMGGSGVLNDGALSTDCSWSDHARDLFVLVNHFRHEMVRPIVGVGHSFGGNILTNLAYLHPRLFSTLLLLDPVIQLSPPTTNLGPDAPAVISSILARPDTWPTRAAAVRAHQKQWGAWDARCTQRMVVHGFRELPTALYPALPRAGKPVTLTTTKYQDLLAQMRVNATGPSAVGRRAYPSDPDPAELAALVDLYRPELRRTFEALPGLRPSCLWVMGGSTHLRREEIVRGIGMCGTGLGGSGGVGKGAVKEQIVDGAGHFFPFERVSDTAGVCADWIQARMAIWRLEEAEWVQGRAALGARGHLVASLY
ncbi:hypothetical protein BDW74DRAFT_185286 [Aspergillus multicolor]|uniref:alpha/beta hydrolase n=1 Tax=Aspergillus multicolor TaxID=41759 RepID=UPI003CCCD219